MLIVAPSLYPPPATTRGREYNWIQLPARSLELGCRAVRVKTVITSPRGRAPSIVCWYYRCCRYSSPHPDQALSRGQELMGLVTALPRLAFTLLPSATPGVRSLGETWRDVSTDPATVCLGYKWPPSYSNHHVPTNGQKEAIAGCRAFHYCSSMLSMHNFVVGVKNAPMPRHRQTVEQYCRNEDFVRCGDGCLCAKSKNLPATF